MPKQVLARADLPTTAATAPRSSGLGLPPSRANPRRQQTEASKRVLLQSRVVANAVRFAAHPGRQHASVGDRKLLALNAIASKPGMGVNELAGTLGVRQPTASQLVKALAASNLVDVHRDSRDRRAVHIRANARGRTVLRRLPAGFDFGDRLPKAVGELDAASLSSLESGLSELLDALPSTAAVLAGRPEDDAHS